MEKYFTVEIEQTGDILDEFETQQEACDKMEKYIKEDRREALDKSGKEELTWEEDHEIDTFYSVYLYINGERIEKLW